MTELKTLKDMAFYCYGEVICRGKNLKQEAIKWLKYHKEHRDDNVVNIVTNPKVEAFIFTFFNLTDEDLK